MQSRTTNFHRIGAAILILVTIMMIVSSCQGVEEKATGTPIAVPALVTAIEPTSSSGFEENKTTDPPSLFPTITGTKLATGTAPETPETQEAAASPKIESQETADPGNIPEADEKRPVDDKSTEPSAAKETIKADGAINSEGGFDSPEGALISLYMEGHVGVLLDEIPDEMRDEVAELLSDRPLEDWAELAWRQVRLTGRRLNFRNFVYNDKGQLPLPPEEIWTITLDGEGASRQDYQGHDLVSIGYVFTSTLLTDVDSVIEAEPELGEVGGVWEEPFLLPVDPDLILQRTGNACINESGFPPNSFDAENAWVFFDYTCDAESAGPAGCHRSRLADLSCVEAMEENTATWETAVIFERLEWDPALADEARIGEVSEPNAPDLKVVGGDLANNWITYRYFPADSCALLEQCVNDSGWRRLLQFDATVHNVGGQPLHIGPVVAADPAHNLFQYNACHDHFHFSDYGDFFFAGEEGNFSSKQAFCVESTSRLSNNEWSPLTHDYHCRYQGVQAGWVDEYHAGLDCQWIDITDVDAANEDSLVTLGFHSNPDQFLCEGTPVLDDDGFQLWEPSGLETPDGREIERPQCDFISDWEGNNIASQKINLPSSGTVVSEPCAGPDNGGHLGPFRNCGFESQMAGVDYTSQPEQDRESGRESGQTIDYQEAGGFLCDPGEPVKLSCTTEGSNRTQILRVCDFSQELGLGIPCVYNDALANFIVDQDRSDTTFMCPDERDEREPGGVFSLFVASLIPEVDGQQVSCMVNN